VEYLVSSWRPTFCELTSSFAESVPHFRELTGSFTEPIKNCNYTALHAYMHTHWLAFLCSSAPFTCNSHLSKEKSRKKGVPPPSLLPGGRGEFGIIIL
jgi:hypothetical protein